MAKPRNPKNEYSPTCILELKLAFLFEYLTAEKKNRAGKTKSNAHSFQDPRNPKTKPKSSTANAVMTTRVINEIETP